MSAATYSCQRCRQPLTIQHSAHLPAVESRLSISQYDTLASQITMARDSVSSTSSADQGAQAIAASATTSQPLLPRKTVGVPPALLAKAPEHQQLFDLLSSASEIDHPVCTECADWWFAKMRKTLEEQKAQRELLLSYESEAKARQAQLTPAKLAAIKEDITRLEDEEKVLVQRLLQAEREKDQLDAEMKELDEEEELLEAEEAEFWRAHSQYLTEQNAHVQASRSLLLSYTSTLNTLEKLQKTNVYADTFCIGHDGGLATINGLRLGRLPNVQVEWAEINAAWGATLLLLKTIARKLEYEIVGYNLVPMSSFSRIERTGEKSSVLELYGSGDWALGRLLQNRRFDAAMVSFLECLRQVIAFAEDRADEQNVNLRIPHQVHKDKIGDVSIRLGSSDETWTRALRHVLLDLKILLADAVR